MFAYAASLLAFLACFRWSTKHSFVIMWNPGLE